MLQLSEINRVLSEVASARYFGPRGPSQWRPPVCFRPSRSLSLSGLRIGSTSSIAAVRAWCDPSVIHLSLKRADLAFSPARPGADALPRAALRRHADRAVTVIMRRWLELALVRLSLFH